jgi:hypothetical protein
MKLSTDIYTNVINTMKCIEELNELKKKTQDNLFNIIRDIDEINNTFNYFGALTENEQCILKNQMKIKGKEFLEESYKVFNIQHKIDELKRRLNNITNN